MESFFEHLSHLINFSPESKQAINDVIIRQTYKKGHILCAPGEICQNLWFIEKGVGRIFYTRNNKEVTEMIMTEGYFLGSWESFFSQTPSNRTVQLLENSVVGAIWIKDLNNLYDRYHDIERLGRLISIRGMTTLLHRTDQLMFSSALERYQDLLQKRPALLDRIPLGIIASYLGITQETLSRMRAQTKELEALDGTNPEQA